MNYDGGSGLFTAIPILLLLYWMFVGGGPRSLIFNICYLAWVLYLDRVLEDENATFYAFLLWIPAWLCFLHFFTSPANEYSVSDIENESKQTTIPSKKKESIFGLLGKLIGFLIKYLVYSFSVAAIILIFIRIYAVNSLPDEESSVVAPTFNSTVTNPSQSPESVARHENDDEYMPMVDCISVYSLARDRAVQNSDWETANSLTEAQGTIYLERPYGYFVTEDINKRKAFHQLVSNSQGLASNSQGPGYLIRELIRCGYTN